MICHCGDPPAGQRIGTGIDQADLPVFRYGLVICDLVPAHIVSQIVYTLVMAGKIIFYHFTFVTKADNKFGDPVGGIDFHNVPQNRKFTDLYQRFRPQTGFLGHTSAEPACKNYSLHDSASCVTDFRV